MSPEFWHFLIGGKYDDDTGVFGNFFAYGKHYEEALHFALEAGRIQNITDAFVEEAGRLDIISEYVRPDDRIQLKEKAFMKPNLHTYPLDGGDVDD